MTSGGSAEKDRLAGRLLSKVCREGGRGLCRFQHDEAGVTAVFFGLMFTAMFLIVAIAVDYGRATHEKSRVQAALDAAVLAASAFLGHEDQDTKGREVAQAYFRENLPDNSEATLEPGDIQFDAATGAVTGTAQTAMPTTMMRVFDQAYINIGAASQVRKGDGTVEVALVLDTSGSMAGTKIEALRTAATNLVTTVFTGVRNAGDVKVGLVPFAASVNVGAEHRGSGWMQTTSETDQHAENFDSARARFDLYDEMSISWAGCVEARTGGLDVTDTVPSGADPDTLFTPMMAPDEPDGHNDAGKSYNNSYLPDDGGTCPRQECNCTAYSRRGNCTSWQLTPITPQVAQARTCKYKVSSTSYSDRCSRSVGGVGPNYMCDSRPILALSDQKQDVIDAISLLAAKGNTNIGEGTMWGLRVLSPAEPFTGGRQYDDGENRKVIVIMTDGVNTYSARDTHNDSTYGAFGYAVKEHLGTAYQALGTVSARSTALGSAMDPKLVAACGAVKGAYNNNPIKVYTVAFGAGVDADTQTLLTNCATTPGDFYFAADEEALIRAFERIGAEISDLRISS